MDGETCNCSNYLKAFSQSGGVHGCGVVIEIFILLPYAIQCHLQEFGSSGPQLTVKEFGHHSKN